MHIPCRGWESKITPLGPRQAHQPILMQNFCEMAETGYIRGTTRAMALFPENASLQRLYVD